MPIDQSPSTVATNALQALDFSSLIGGPMDAIIKAQALAARTTHDYINQVGLNTDPKTGEKSPVNVVFQYNNNGQMTTLTVPLLVMVPIPNLEVSQFSIDFVANISAASSSTQETTSDSEIGVDAEAEASLSFGLFSVRIKTKANYSSKQHSKAAQESKYSVEYTMNVHVEGGQAGMPAGMQTMLNILQGSTSSVSPDDQIAIYPSELRFENSDVNDLQITIRNPHGVLTPGANVSVKLDVPANFLKPEVIGATTDGIRKALRALQENKPLASLNDPSLIIDRRVLLAYSKYYDASEPLTDPDVNGNTDQKGAIKFAFTLSESAKKTSTDISGTITVTVQMHTTDEKGNPSRYSEAFNIPYLIVAKTPAP